jgi:hypothetical protein
MQIDIFLSKFYTIFSSNSCLIQKMQILPVRDLNCALHEFVDRDDKMAFHSCLQVKIEKKGDIPSQISEYPKFQTV